MAQGAVATMPMAMNGTSMTAEELREMLEYDRIVQFRDAVFAGAHPRVKIPSHLAPKLNGNGSNHNFSSPNLPTPPLRSNSNATNTARSINLESASSYYKLSANNQRGAAGSQNSLHSNPEIMPVLLEKSDDLIKAEIQLQRQRLEKNLKDQIEQQKIAAKASQQTSESLPNFDLSEVLSKALAIVHPFAADDLGTSAEASARAPSPVASDSFDDNTFYSSQHDTPDGSVTSQGRKEAEALSDGELVTDNSTQSQVKDADVVLIGSSLPQNNNVAEQARPQTQHLQAQPNKPKLDQRSDTSKPSSTENFPKATASASGDVQISGQNVLDEPLRQAVDDVPRPLVRAHNLSPFAPQPARVSPLATARDPPILRQITGDEAHPAQVSALRNENNGLSSTDSSPREKNTAEKKKEKNKKKRKGKEPADTPNSPYIKPEPRSPSPFAAPLPRPQKRQRQSGQFSAELRYDGPRVVSGPEVRERLPDTYTEVRPVREYERVPERYEPVIRRPEPVYQRVEIEDDSYRPIDDRVYARRPESPAVFALPYAPSESRMGRAVSHAVPISRLQEEPRYHREPVVRASVRPDADRERSRSPVRDPRSPVIMGPPRQQPMRLMMDEYGRKFYEQIPVSSMRQSVAPLQRYRDSEGIYERAPVRTYSSRAPVEYEEDGIIYRRQSPVMVAPRRVVTQPEYAALPQPEYRSYRQREYSVRPTTMGPPGEEFIQLRGAPERGRMSAFEEAPREYIQRAPSVRPEPVRYEIPAEYPPRHQSVRPEAPPREYAASVRPEYAASVRPEAPREYAASVHPEARREVIPLPPQREYSVRPGEMIPQRERIIDADGYYEEVPPARRHAEIAYIERPRAREASVVVYADDVRRAVYR